MKTLAHDRQYKTGENDGEGVCAGKGCEIQVLAETIMAYHKTLTGPHLLVRCFSAQQSEVASQAAVLNTLLSVASICL